ncbi:hypothetical protein GOBAR_DD06701 [Gossypium barbadense]|nr:hypothetical protein GOBAR_DD06701 [Gossypium barbadense]
MSPDGDGAINGCCPFSFSSGENGIPGSHDDTCKHCTRSQSLSSSPSALGSDSVLLVDSNKLRRIFVASAKGLSIGAGLKGGLALFSILARLLRKKSRTAKWRALVAGLVAGPSMLLTGHNTQHKSLAIYILMRAAVLASRCGIKSKRFGKLCKPLTWKHGDIFLMCLSSSQIFLYTNEFNQQARGLHYSFSLSFLTTIQPVKAVILMFACCLISSVVKSSFDLGFIAGTLMLKSKNCSKPKSSYILKQDSLPPSYRSFLNKHGGKDLVILQGVKEIACGLPFTNLEAIEKLYKASGVDVKLDPNMKIPCSSCVKLCKFAVLEVNPARLWTCLLFRLFRRCNIPMVAMGTFPTGLALAIEKKSRRIEISLYCLARAIESFFTCMADIGYLPQSTNLKRADVVIFSLSTAIIMHCYAQEREVFRSKYLNVLDWVFGVPPPCETPRCKDISTV